MSTNLFAYGTLIIPQVFQAVTGRSFDAMDAELDGFSRYTLEGKVYPGLIEESGGYVDGRVYMNLDDEALSRLRYFEDNIYEERELTLTLDNNSKVQALTFVMRSADSDKLSDMPWSMKQFREKQLESYLINTRKFMRDYRG